MKVLITGGAGYIGSTVASACEDSGHEVVILDDFSTGRREFIGDRAVYEGDFADEALLERVFSEHSIDAVVHCAAKIVVPESVEQPLDYYENNVSKTITLLRAMERAGVLRFLFSSSASIYAPDENFIVTEDSPLSPGSPYARTKYIVEMILEDFTRASAMKVLSLRYFNPIGTDPKLRSGQQLEKPSHVLAKLLEAWSKGETFTVTGVEWPTRDGSGIRDFIHVWDLAQAHVAALEGFDKATATSSYEVFNIGTGSGVTVKELAASFEAISGDALKVQEGPSRPGDVAGVYTVSSKAKDVLGWEAKLTEQEAVRDAIAWLPVRREMLGY
ncbi:UDP-glucose 4-epimerase GalE [Tessaracoccus sp. MC1627]|uniref:UDP-glucose 4-epimerase GalE n=1 Tax=Tessaracoccus sp. MC1627 TaxID=2760312 RepID=UPI0015FF209F|nr:UDP-glucose 4-epimerase GalE [Tessaracoccus sp. MC1627]MBB1511346.1 UDP-glucose 4-epimerase GalE [Tessaracoccus sp. MC1627]